MIALAIVLYATGCFWAAMVVLSDPIFKDYHGLLRALVILLYPIAACSLLAAAAAGAIAEKRQ